MDNILNTYEQDPRYIDYLKTTDNPSYMGFEFYCGELYNKELNEALKKHADRNEIFLDKINHIETFIWLQDYMKNMPPRMSRSDVGDEFFNAHLSIMGCYNSLMMELSLENLNEDSLLYFLNKIADKKQIILLL